MEPGTLVQISCAVLNTVLVAVVVFRRQPPLDREFYAAMQQFVKDYPSKADMANCAARCTQSVADVRHDLEKLREEKRSDMANAFERIERHREAVNQAIRDLDRVNSQRVAR